MDSSWFILVWVENQLKLALSQIFLGLCTVVTVQVYNDPYTYYILSRPLLEFDILISIMLSLD